MNAQRLETFQSLKALRKDAGSWTSDMTTPHRKFCNKAAAIIASCELTGCKNWRDFIWLSSGIYKGEGKLTKLGV